MEELEDAQVSSGSNGQWVKGLGVVYHEGGRKVYIPIMWLDTSNPKTNTRELAGRS